MPKGKKPGGAHVGDLFGEIVDDGQALDMVPAYSADDDLDFKARMERHLDELGVEAPKRALMPGMKSLGELIPAMNIRPMSSVQERVVDASASIRTDPPDRMSFLHTVLCQVGMPRRAMKERTFERRSGGAIMRLDAGAIFNGRDLVDQPLPYGTKPRLVMVHISSEAIRTGQRHVEIGDSVRAFLLALGIDPTGGPRGGYTMFRKQMEALAACRMTLGLAVPGRNLTLNTQPISRFEAWTHNDDHQRSLWPGVLELSQDFYSTLKEYAVPLDHRALGAIKHSAMALDIYTWLAHRLCRIDEPKGVRLSWNNLKDQFGQEYGNVKDFRREFIIALKQVLSVYPDAKITDVTGGILLRYSQPPVAKTTVSMSRKVGGPVDK